MRIAQWMHRPEAHAADLLAAIKKNHLTAVYQALFPTDEHSLLSSLQQANKEHLATLQTKLADAQQNFGESEVFDALLATAEYHAHVSPLAAALSAYRIAYEKAVGVGARLDIVLAQIRLGLFWSDTTVAHTNIQKAHDLLKEGGGDWDRRNRLKVYEALYSLLVRDFSTASKLLVDSLPTFTSTELIDNNTFIQYTILSAVLCLPRAELKKRVLSAPEVLEVIHNLPHFQSFAASLYECQYAAFFQALVEMEQFMKQDKYLVRHYKYFTREMRILAYQQLLESYASLSLASMARSFGVSAEFIDAELSKLIAAGRVSAVIDKVATTQQDGTGTTAKGVVKTCRPDYKNGKYQAMVKQGDQLLNRVQKLGRVINV